MVDRADRAVEKVRGLLPRQELRLRGDARDLGEAPVEGVLDDEADVVLDDLCEEVQDGSEGGLRVQGEGCWWNAPNRRLSSSYRVMHFISLFHH